MMVLVISAALCLLAVAAAVVSLACAARTGRKANLCLCRVSGLSARVGALNRRLAELEKKRADRCSGAEKSGGPEAKEERQTERWLQGLTDILAYSGASRKKEERPE